jgi:hypothetical protein
MLSIARPSTHAMQATMPPPIAFLSNSNKLKLPGIILLGRTSNPPTTVDQPMVIIYHRFKKMTKNSNFYVGITMVCQICLTTRCASTMAAGNPL